MSSYLWCGTPGWTIRRDPPCDIKGCIADGIPACLSLPEPPAFGIGDAARRPRHVIHREPHRLSLVEPGGLKATCNAPLGGQAGVGKTCTEVHQSFISATVGASES
jgi:hypothetical protein